MTLCGERSGFSLSLSLSLWAYYLGRQISAFSHTFCSISFLPLLSLFLFLPSARVLAPSDQPAEVEFCDKSSCVERQTATCPAGLVDDALMVILNFPRSLSIPLGGPGLQTPAHYCAASISARFTKESTLYSINSTDACKIDSEFVAVSTKARPFLNNLMQHLIKFVHDNTNLSIFVDMKVINMREICSRVENLVI